MNDIGLNLRKEEKDLGVVIDSNLTFDKLYQRKSTKQTK